MSANGTFKHMVAETPGEAPSGPTRKQEGGLFHQMVSKRRQLILSLSRHCLLWLRAASAYDMNVTTSVETIAEHYELVPATRLSFFLELEHENWQGCLCFMR